MKTAKQALRYLFIICFWLAIWAFAAWRVGYPLLFPSPKSVFRCLWELMQTAEFYNVLLNSFFNVISGILIAVLLGLLLSGLTFRIKLLRELLLPLMTVIKATPVASFIVLALIWIGAARVPSFITVLIVLPIVWTNLDEGLTKLDPKLSEVTRVYRVPPLRRLTLLIIPSLKPYFLSACRTSIGLAWKAGIAAEIIARPRNSIGTMIGDAKQYLETDAMFAWTLTVILFSLLIEYSVTLLIRRFGTNKRKGGAIC